MNFRLESNKWEEEGEGGGNDWRAAARDDGEGEEQGHELRV